MYRLSINILQQAEKENRSRSDRVVSNFLERDVCGMCSVWFSWWISTEWKHTGSVEDTWLLRYVLFGRIFHRAREPCIETKDFFLLGFSLHFFSRLEPYIPCLRHWYAIISSPSFTSMSTLPPCTQPDIKFKHSPSSLSFTLPPIMYATIYESMFYYSHRCFLFLSSSQPKMLVRTLFRKLSFFLNVLCTNGTLYSTIRYNMSLPYFLFKFSHPPYIKKLPTCENFFRGWWVKAQQL